MVNVKIHFKAIRNSEHCMVTSFAKEISAVQEFVV